MNVVEQIQAPLRRNPGRVFLADPSTGRFVTYGEFAGLASGLARRLRREGVQAGDRVAACLDNSPEYAVFYFSCALLGAAAVPLNPALHVTDMAFILKTAGAKQLLFRRVWNRPWPPWKPAGSGGARSPSRRREKAVWFCPNRRATPRIGKTCRPQPGRTYSAWCSPPAPRAGPKVWPTGWETWSGALPPSMRSTGWRRRTIFTMSCPCPTPRVFSTS